MQVSLKLTVKAGDVSAAGGPAVVVNLYEGVKEPGGATKAVDDAAGGMVTRAVESGDFKGKLGEILVLYPEGKGLPERVVLLGLGKKDDFDAEAARKAAGAMAGCLRSLKVKKAVTVVHGADSGHPARDMARALAEGLLIGVYRYDNYLNNAHGDPLELQEVTVMEKNRGRVRGIQAGVELGTLVAEGVNQARELANGPSNEITPTYLANTAADLGKKHGFKVTALGPKECEKENMGAFLGVARGSHEPCRFIVMEYEGKNPRGTVCLVGKGITFDSGGISLKPGQDMDQMKFDMSGAAAVIGAMRFAASQKVPLRVIGLVAATENMPGGSAYKPGDILTSSAGVTIEILNTDAEGRLALADGLAYARRFDPDAVIDLATLTGACVIALGNQASGLMSNDEWMLDAVYDASRKAGDRAWPLPLWTEYRDQIRSKVADIKNTGGRAAGAITAGAFLGAFTNTYRWAHLDIAGTAWGESGKSYHFGDGGTGSGVRILAEFLMGWKKPRGKGPEPGPRTSLGTPPREKKAEAPAAKAANKKTRRNAMTRTAGAGKRKTTKKSKRRR